MLFEIDPTLKQATSLSASSLGELGLRERYDLQEWVLSNPAILGEELFVVTDEFSRFDRTRERLDVLAVDPQGKLVIVELKRSALGSHADLQAIRYAAYCSNFTLQDLAEIHCEFLRRRGEPEVTHEESRRRVLEFIGAPGFTELDDRPRIIFGAEEFPPEITSTVLWLRSCGIDMRCVRLRPYQLGERMLVDASVLIPLPEAEAYVIRRERKEAEQAQRVRGATTPEELVLQASTAVQPVLTLVREALLANSDLKGEVRGGVLTYRRVEDRSWYTLLRPGPDALWVAVPPEAPLPPTAPCGGRGDGPCSRSHPRLSGAMFRTSSPPTTATATSTSKAGLIRTRPGRSMRR